MSIDPYWIDGRYHPRSLLQREEEPVWRTPLSRAVETGDEIIVELLLKYGAQPDLEDRGGQAPLSRAICNTVLVELLNSYLHHECGLEPSFYGEDSST